MNNELWSCLAGCHSGGALGSRESRWWEQRGKVNPGVSCSGQAKPDPPPGPPSAFLPSTGIEGGPGGSYCTDWGTFTQGVKGRGLTGLARPQAPVSVESGLPGSRTEAWGVLCCVVLGQLPPLSGLNCALCKVGRQRSKRNVVLGKEKVMLVIRKGLQNCQSNAHLQKHRQKDKMEIIF